MNVVNSKAFEESDYDKFDPEFIRFIESLKQKYEDYDMLIDILNIIMQLSFAKLTFPFMRRKRIKQDTHA